MTTPTLSQRYARLLVERKQFDTYPRLGGSYIDLSYDFAGLEFWDDERGMLFIAACVPDDSQVTNGLLALISHLEQTIFRKRDTEPYPSELYAALIVPFGQVKTKFPDDFTVFVLHPEYQLLIELLGD